MITLDFLDGVLIERQSYTEVENGVCAGCFFEKFFFGLGSDYYAAEKNEKITVIPLGGGAVKILSYSRLVSINLLLFEDVDASLRNDIVGADNSEYHF